MLLPEGKHKQNAFIHHVLLFCSQVFELEGRADSWLHSSLEELFVSEQFHLDGTHIARVRTTICLVGQLWFVSCQPEHGGSPRESFVFHGLIVNTFVVFLVSGVSFLKQRCIFSRVRT